MRNETGNVICPRKSGQNMDFTTHALGHQRSTRRWTCRHSFENGINVKPTRLLIPGAREIIERACNILTYDCVRAEQPLHRELVPHFAFILAEYTSLPLIKRAIRDIQGVPSVNKRVRVRSYKVIYFPKTSLDYDYVYSPLG